MEIYPSFKTPKHCSPPLTLTIGNFDGVHLGHQKILSELKKVAGANGTVGVITFSNHPSHVLPNLVPAPLIFPPARKLELLKHYGADVVFLLEFTLDLAKLTYMEFFEKVRSVYPFDLLILGEGAALGRKREGTKEKMEILAHEQGFTLKHLPKVEVDGEEISSGKIRSYLAKGDLTKARALLGHPLKNFDD